MKSTELMVGDWVHIAHNGKASHFGKVTALLSSGAVETEIEGALALSSSVDPIPITPEILVKNGWAYNYVDKVFYPAQFRGELPWMVGTNGVFRVRDFCEIRYVHELQHALRLCGIDKEITI